MARLHAKSFLREKKRSSVPVNVTVDDRMLRDLAFLYPDPQSELAFRNNYELLLAVVLSAQCTDKKVNEVTPTLFGRYPDFPSLSRATVGDLETILRPINYFKTKARNLKALAEIVVSKFGGEVPRTAEDLQSLPGVGQKTSNVVLGEMRVQPTLAVDTHVFRVAHRLGLTIAKKPTDVEEDLKKLFDPSLWRNLHHWLILHGRRVCKAQRPLCSTCILLAYCPHGRLENGVDVPLVENSKGNSEKDPKPKTTRRKA